MGKYQSLLAQKAALERAIAKIRQREIGKAIKEINVLIQKYDLSPNDLRFASSSLPSKTRKAPSKAPTKRSKLKATLTPLYRDPETGATWSGRGRSPKWVVGNKEDYKISEAQDDKPSDTPASSDSLK